MLKQELEHLLAAPFSKAGFTSLMREVLPGWQPAEALVHLNGAEHDLLVQATSLGNASGGNAGLDLEVLVVEVASGHNVHSSRSTQRALLTRLLREQQREAALAAFYCHDSGSWRLSFVHLTWQHGADGKVKTEVLAPLRRYSFIVGRGEPIHTATQQLLELLNHPSQPSLDDIEHAFSVDRVTKEFYSGIAELFTRLTGGIRTVHGKSEQFPMVLHMPSVADAKVAKEFGVRLIGRLLFAWFLKKKVGPIKGALVPDSLLSLSAVSKAIEFKRSYYHDTIEPLFFETLNTPPGERRHEYRVAPWSSVPFLNGGLFEAHQEDFYERNEAGQSVYFATLRIPNEWLRELFQLFDEYNFTIDENLSVDIDLAVEPEMLGRIFENLLAEIDPDTQKSARKATGSYYTRRQIVDFMVDEALGPYLTSKTGLSTTTVAALLAHDAPMPHLSADDRSHILDALESMRAIDPACGSGAFPMGILQKALLVLSKVDPGAEQWYKRQLDAIADIGVRTRFEQRMRGEEREYIHKLGLVCNCIYGVDIQPIAVEMSRLRFLLALMVDEVVDDEAENRGIQALPNLEFKFVCADSLRRAPWYQRGSIFANTADLYFPDLATSVTTYFYESRPSQKKALRAKIEELISSRTDAEKKSGDRLLKNARTEEQSAHVKVKQKNAARQHLQDSVSWDSYRNLFTGQPVSFFEVPYFFPDVNGQFDIVIGNPPYGLQVSDDVRNLYFDQDKEGSQSKDSYGAFVARALELLRPGGQLCFILSNTWRTLGTHVPFRRRLLRAATLRVLVDMPPWIFNAVVDTVILGLCNLPPSIDSQVQAVGLRALPVETWPQLEDALQCLLLPSLPPDASEASEVEMYSYPQHAVLASSSVPLFIASPRVFNLAFDKSLVSLSEVSDIKQGLATEDNHYYLRQAPNTEAGYALVDLDKVLSPSEIESLPLKERINGIVPGLHHGRHFVPYDKGGESDTDDGWLPNYYVPTEYYIDWSTDAVLRMCTYTVADVKLSHGEEGKIHPGDEEKTAVRMSNRECYFHHGITFSRTGAYCPTFRLGSASVFDVAGSMVFPTNVSLLALLGLLASTPVRYIVKCYINHTVNIQVDDLKRLKVPRLTPADEAALSRFVQSIIDHQQTDGRYPYWLHEQREIDALVYHLYGLTQVDVKEVTSWYCRRYPKLAQAQGLLVDRKGC